MVKEVIPISEQKKLSEYNKKKDKRKIRKIKEQKKSGRIDKKKLKKTIKKVKEEREKKNMKENKPKTKGTKVKTETKKHKEKKTTNVFNVGSYIRKNTKLNVSPGFVDEEISRIKDGLDMDVREAEQIATSMGMKTLMEVHAIRIYDYRMPEKTTIVSCDSCGNSFVIAMEKASKKMYCPFCGQKRYIRIE